MRNYGTVSPRFWIGETGKELRGDPEVQVLALYLMTSPHANMIGVYHCPILYMAHETGLSVEGASKALRRLIDGAFCEYDETSETVFVTTMAKYQIGESLDAKDKRIGGIRKEVEKLPGKLKRLFFQIYGDAYHLGEGTEEPSPSEAPSKPHRSQEQKQKQEQKQNGHSSAVPTDVQAVFDHWRAEHKHANAQLDQKRLKLIRVALKSYSAEQLCQAISGYKNSPHHMGQNDRKTVYDDIELFLRDAKHIDAGLKFAEQVVPRSDWRNDPRYRGAI